MTVENPTNIFESLPRTKFEFLQRVFKGNMSTVSFDLDEILSDTQTPVKRKFDNIFGTDFCDLEKLRIQLFSSSLVAQS